MLYCEIKLLLEALIMFTAQNVVLANVRPAFETIYQIKARIYKNNNLVVTDGDMVCIMFGFAENKLVETRWIIGTLHFRTAHALC